jgi:hypothetical protein
LPPLLQRFQCSIAPVASSKQDDMTSLTSNGPGNCRKLGVLWVPTVVEARSFGELAKRIKAH